MDSRTVCKRFRNAMPGSIPMLLATGGICWGGLLLPMILQAEHRLLPILLFGPGYVVTLGYLIRAFSTPSLGGRYVIWGFRFSIKVDGWDISSLPR